MCLSFCWGVSMYNLFPYTMSLPMGKRLNAKSEQFVLEWLGWWRSIAGRAGRYWQFRPPSNPWSVSGVFSMSFCYLIRGLDFFWGVFFAWDKSLININHITIQKLTLWACENPSQIGSSKRCGFGFLPKPRLCDGELNGSKCHPATAVLLLL